MDSFRVRGGTGVNGPKRKPSRRVDIAGLMLWLTPFQASALRMLRVIILKCRVNRFLSQHRAVHFYRG